MAVEQNQYTFCYTAVSMNINCTALIIAKKNLQDTYRHEKDTVVYRHKNALTLAEPKLIVRRFVLT